MDGSLERKQDHEDPIINVEDCFITDNVISAKNEAIESFADSVFEVEISSCCLNRKKNVHENSGLDNGNDLYNTARLDSSDSEQNYDTDKNEFVTELAKDLVSEVDKKTDVSISLESDRESPMMEELFVTNSDQLDDHVDMDTEGKEDSVKNQDLKDGIVDGELVDAEIENEMTDEGKANTVPLLEEGFVANSDHLDDHIDMDTEGKEDSVKNQDLKDGIVDGELVDADIENEMTDDGKANTVPLAAPSERQPELTETCCSKCRTEFETFEQQEHHDCRRRAYVCVYCGTAYWVMELLVSHWDVCDSRDSRPEFCTWCDVEQASDAESKTAIVANSAAQVDLRETRKSCDDEYHSVDGDLSKKRPPSPVVDAAADELPILDVTANNMGSVLIDNVDNVTPTRTDARDGGLFARNGCINASESPIDMMDHQTAKEIHSLINRDYDNLSASLVSRDVEEPVPDSGLDAPMNNLCERAVEAVNCEDVADDHHSVSSQAETVKRSVELPTATHVDPSTKTEPVSLTVESMHPSDASHESADGDAVVEETAPVLPTVELIHNDDSFSGSVDVAAADLNAHVEPSVSPSTLGHGPKDGPGQRTSFQTPDSVVAETGIISGEKCPIHIDTLLEFHVPNDSTVKGHIPNDILKDPVPNANPFPAIPKGPVSSDSFLNGSAHIDSPDISDFFNINTKSDDLEGLVKGCGNIASTMESGNDNQTDSAYMDRGLSDNRSGVVSVHTNHIDSPSDLSNVRQPSTNDHIDITNVDYSRLGDANHSDNVSNDNATAQSFDGAIAHDTGTADVTLSTNDATLDSSLTKDEIIAMGDSIVDDLSLEIDGDLLCPQNVEDIVDDIDVLMNEEFTPDLFISPRRKHVSVCDTRDVAIAVEVPRPEVRPQWYKCVKCGRRSHSLHELHRHCKTHLFETMFQCWCCDAEFHKYHLLEIHELCHARDNNWNIPSFMCQVQGCTQGFRFYTDWFNHLCKHMRFTGVYYCDKCDLIYSIKKCLDDHLAMAHPRHLPKPMCLMCDMIFNDVAAIQQHAMAHHDAGLDWKSGNARSCVDCSADFQSFSALNLHRLEHLNMNYERVCATCSLRYYGVQPVPRCLHSLKESMLCAVCSIRFASHTDAMYHRVFRHALDPAMEVRQESSVKSLTKMSFQCNLCANKYNTAQAYKRHMENHKNNICMPFACTICGHAFRTKCYLDNHMNSHTGRKPFRCKTCCYRFSQRGSLEKHMSVHEVVPGCPMHNCSLCEARFNKKSSRDFHQKMHSAPGGLPSEEVNFCTICGASFDGQSSRKRHERLHHKNSAVKRAATAETSSSDTDYDPYMDKFGRRRPSKPKLKKRRRRTLPKMESVASSSSSDQQEEDDRDEYLCNMKLLMHGGANALGKSATKLSQSAHSRQLPGTRKSRRRIKPKTLEEDFYYSRLKDKEDDILKMAEKQQQQQRIVKETPKPAPVNIDDIDIDDISTSDLDELNSDPDELVDICEKTKKDDDSAEEGEGEEEEEETEYDTGYLLASNLE